jgi:hypothetical protein
MSAFQNKPRSAIEGELAVLRPQAAAYHAEIEAIKAELRVRLEAVETKLQKVRSTIGAMEAELSRREAMDSIEPSVSDHAVLRYMERVHGIDVEQLRGLILTETVEKAIRAGASAVRVDGMTYVIKGATIVTVLGSEQRPKKKTKRGTVETDCDEAEDAA